MFNHVGEMGRLVSDPELKTTPAGVSVTSFRIAVERNYTDKDGNRQADFFDVVAWRGTAEFICRYFGKGSLILVEGQLQSRTVEIVADKAHFTGERRDSQSNQQQSQPSQHGNRQQTNLPPAQQGPGYATDYEAPPLGDDDLPF